MLRSPGRRKNMQMTTENQQRAIEIVLYLLKHPLVSQSYVAAQLYGEDSSSNRSRLNHRITGKYRWQEWELRRVLVVFEDFADLIDGQRDAVAGIPEMRADYDAVVAAIVAAEEFRAENDEPVPSSTALKAA